MTKISEKDYLFLMAKVESMSTAEKIWRLAQLCEYEQWLAIVRLFLADGVDKEGNNKQSC